MLQKLFAREAPAPPPIDGAGAASRPPVPIEPQLETAEIQGNIVPGFNKDFQALLFLQITDVDRCREWLKSLAPFISTTEQVLAFNRLFKSLRSSQGSTGTLRTVWTNIAFTFPGLDKLARDANLFKDASFKSGLPNQAQELGDPTDDPAAPGNPANWLIGGGNRPADIVVIVAGDDQGDTAAMVSRIENSILSPIHPGGVDSGVKLIFRQQGAVLPPPLKGHEHFGFLDGVSQPGVRGRVSADPRDVLTPRQNPLDPDQGKPGQDLLWPGEFVFGYPGQDPAKGVSEPGPVVDAGPAWGRNGSYLVFRRLQQDVGEFHRFLNAQAKVMIVSSAKFGAMIVGRWSSGAPILRSQASDDPPLGDNDCANNDFEFFKPSPLPPDDDGSDTQCSGSGIFPASPGDQPGDILPLCGHIRKTYPRDDKTPAGTGATPAKISETSEQDTQTHRMLRRGIPFGSPSRSTPEVPLPDQGERGLLFVAYQTSIVNQFEFVTKNWVNNPKFRDPDAGFDLVLGQNPTPGERRVRKAKVNGAVVSTEGFKEWVVPTGGGYFFAPSITALKKLSGAMPFTTSALNVVVAPGSKAERICRAYAGRPGQPFLAPVPVKPLVIAPGIPSDHSRDLIFRRGKTIADLVFTNFYVGGAAAWSTDDRAHIDNALSAAMADVNLNNVILQYFPNSEQITSTFRTSHILSGQPPKTFGKSDVEGMVASLHQSGQLAGFDFGNTVFNFMLPRETVLTDDDAGSGQSGRTGIRGPSLVDADDAASSLEGLGGYHGSVHDGGQIIYYAVGVFSEGNNGIDAFGVPWKNMVATFYHELNEARTDPDVEDANRTGNESLIGWTSQQGDEIGDIPIEQAGSNLGLVFKQVPLTGGNGMVPIQLQYSNAVGGPEGPIAAPHPRPA